MAEQSSGAQVADLLETDSNQGVTDNGFKISGLADSYYNITLSSGNLTNPITTKVVVGGISYVADSDPGVWRTLTFKTAAANGIIDFNFQRTGVNLWAINAIILTPSVGAPAEATLI